MKNVKRDCVHHDYGEWGGDQCDLGGILAEALENYGIESDCENCESYEKK